MVQAENIDSRCSSFQLDDRSRRDHYSLAHGSKFPLSGAAIRRASSLPSSFAADLIGLSWPCCYYRRKKRPTWEEGNGMVHAENIDSRCSSFQLDDCSRRDHRSLAHRSKFPLSGAGTPPPRLIVLPHVGSIASGNLAMWDAIRRASSLVSSLAADRRPGSFSK